MRGEEKKKVRCPPRSSECELKNPKDFYTTRRTTTTQVLICGEFHSFLERNRYRRSVWKRHLENGMEQLKVRVMAKNKLFVCSSGKMVLGTIRTSGICTLRIRAKKRKDEEKITFRIVSKLTVLFPFWKKRFRVSSVGLTPLCKRYWNHAFYATPYL